MKKGVVDLLILSRISGGAVSGVDLVGALDPDFPPGTIYPALSRLERNGFIMATKRTAETGRQRKEYDLSPAGREELAILTGEWRDLSTRVESILEEVKDAT